MGHNHEECCVQEYELCSCISLGQRARDFEAITTHGKIKLSEYGKGSWVLLFSHPADFTPVCTTEFSAFAERQEEFDKRNVKLLGLSIDSVYSHIAWVKDIEKIYDVKIKFPIIADLTREVANSYGMIHPEISEIHAVRTIVLIDPEGIIRFFVSYPQSVGRNIDEILRIIDALQLVDKEGIATPVNWKPGDSVIVPPPQTQEDAEKREKEHEGHEECSSWYLCKKKV